MPILKCSTEMLKCGSTSMSTHAVKSHTYPACTGVKDSSSCVAPLQAAILHPAGGGFISVILIFIFIPYFLHLFYAANLHQHLWYPAPWTSRQQLDSVRLALLLRGHLLHSGLRRCHSSDLALATPGGHYDLCGTHRASHSGEKQWW